MKKITITLLILSLCAGLFATGAADTTSSDTSLEDLKARGVFVLGLDDSFPPLGFRNEKNEIVGYDIDLAKEVAKRLGVAFKAQPISWDAKEMELQTGKIDCIWNGLTITEPRLKALSFTKPYLKNTQVLVVRNDSGIKSLKDMKGKTIGIQSGSSAQDAVEASPDFKKILKNIVPFEQNLMALNDLQIGGVDGVVMDSVVAEYSIKASGLPLHTLKEGLAAEEYGVAFRKGDKALTAAVQKILEEMQKDGTVAAISNKWFGTDISVIGK